jgi:hypothetical protein
MKNIVLEIKVNMGDRRFIGYFFQVVLVSGYFG